MWLLLALCASAADPTALERVDSATRVLQQARAAHGQGQGSVEEVYRWSVRVYEAERDAGVPGAAANHAARMRELAAATTALVATGAARAADADAVRFYQAEAAGWTGGSPPAPPAPPATPPPAAPAAPAAPPADIDQCFASCDAVARTCSTDAEHFRLGMGAVAPGDPDCERKAVATCGDGKSPTKVECRDTQIRACQAAKRAADCAKSQTTCNARCR